MTPLNDTDRELIRRCLAGTAAPEEQQLVEARAAREPEYAYELQVEKSMMAAGHAAGAAGALRLRMQQMKTGYVQPEPRFTSYKKWLWTVAAVVLMAALSLWWFQKESDPEPIPVPTVPKVPTPPTVPVNETTPPEITAVTVPTDAAKPPVASPTPKAAPITAEPAAAPLATPTTAKGITVRKVPFIKFQNKGKYYIYDGKKLELLGDFDIPTGRLLIKNSQGRVFFEYKGLYYEIRLTNQQPAVPELVHDIQVLSQIRRIKPDENSPEVIFPHLYSPGNYVGSVSITVEPLGNQGHYLLKVKQPGEELEITLYGEYFDTPAEFVYSLKTGLYHLILDGIVYRLEPTGVQEKLKKENDSDILSVFNYSAKK